MSHKKGDEMSYCPSKDCVHENIKRANEKKKKNRAIKKDYRTSKSRNLYTIPCDIKGKKASEDPDFERVAPGKFKKVYA